MPQSPDSWPPGPQDQDLKFELELVKDARGTPIARDVSGPGSQAPHHISAGTSVATAPGPGGDGKREVSWAQVAAPLSAGGGTQGPLGTRFYLRNSRGSRQLEMFPDAQD